MESNGYEIFEKLLNAFGLSRYRLSKETGVGEAVLSAWKRGISKPNHANMNKIAKYFEVTVWQLYGDQSIDFSLIKPETNREVAPTLK